MRLVFLSDTHCLHGQVQVPDGDMVLHAGDFSGRGRLTEVTDFLQWFSALPHRHKVLIAGNHDFMAERDAELFLSLVPENVTYLRDQEVTLEGIRIYGSPWQPEFFNWAFNLKRGAELDAVWSKIPEGVDILLTHGPPMQVLDKVNRGPHVGCEDLLRHVLRTRPAIHCFGHIHEGYGQARHGGTLFLNASICTLHYLPTQLPWVVEWESRERISLLMERD